MSAPLLGTESAADAIARVKYSHDAMIDMIICNPGITGPELGKAFGYTSAWVSRITNSDAFQARLAERKEDLVDPGIVASIETKMKALASKSLDVVLEKLSVTQNPDTALKALEITAKALGFGARDPRGSTNINFVVAMPQQARSEGEWVKSHNIQIVEAQSETL